MKTTPINRRSILVYSALEVARWDEVMHLGADLVAFDLEDGTAEDRKDEARRLCLPYFAKAAQDALTEGSRALLRINSPRTLHGIKDLCQVAELVHPPTGLILPKIEFAEDVTLVAEVLHSAGKNIELIPLIESQVGVRNASQIAAASSMVSGLFLGAVDYSAERRSDMGWDALYHARSLLVEACSECRIDCIDGPWLDVDDMAGMRLELPRLASMGMTGKASYEPVQLPAIHAAFTPSPDEIDYAQRVIQAVQASPTGGAKVDGKPVNKANAKGAAKVLDLARIRSVYTD